MQGQYVYSLDTLNINPDNPLGSSFPRRRESSKINSPRSGQNLDIGPLRGDCSTNWIPACAGMTSSEANGQFGINVCCIEIARETRIYSVSSFPRSVDVGALAPYSHGVLLAGAAWMLGLQPRTTTAYSLRVQRGCWGFSRYPKFASL